jgi:hypothetical protein
LVSELREKLDLREDLAVAGKDLRVCMNPESLTKSCESGPVFDPTPLRTVAVLGTLAAVATFTYALSTGTIWPFLVVLLFFESIIYTRFRARATAAISGVSSNAEGMVLFSKIVERLRSVSGSPHPDSTNCWRNSDKAPSQLRAPSTGSHESSTGSTPAGA